MWRELRTVHHNVSALAAGTGHSVPLDAAGSAAAPRKTVRQAIWQIVVADISMSLDNVLAVAGASRAYPYILIFGLVLSVALMGVAASFIAGLLQKHRWIGYVGLAIIVYVALDMCYRGAREVWLLCGAARGPTDLTTAQLGACSVQTIQIRTMRQP